ncbi:hypothetical protein B0G71_4350 [Paraburkholderia sp. BL27I4N3]|uniref:hypothetical protein n=1 Tax=Paraburkholderia sp. BL27I4N3 TaxID=1938805 RepID=UPI000E36AF7C|nr:hypothetical protein [Paraburkholderia sp. BL27I4N3]REE21198.1 hypothetical protein B0G71_4350 [Paraburkholderia sp. BL27I4N3]
MSNSESGSTALGILVIAAGVAYAAHSGWFYQTGQQWFDSCWSSINSKAPASSATEATAWAQCEPQTKRALFDAGYIFSGNPQYAVTPELQAVTTACPSNFTDIPMAGIQIMAVDMIEKDGGPQWIDKFLPPDRMIVRTFDKRWPTCVTTRAANGFPKIVPKGDSWDWAGPCKPCEAEKAAMGK